MRRAPAILLLLALPTALGAETSRLEEARRALARAQAAAITAAAKAKALDAQAAADRAAAESAHRAGATTRIELRAAQARVAAAQARLAEIDRARALAAERLAAERAPLAGLLAAVERMAMRPPALALAEPRSIEDVARTRSALAALTPAITARTAAVRAELAEGRRLHAEAEQAEQRLIDAQKLVAARQAAFDRDEKQALARADTATSDAEDVRQALAALADELSARRARVAALGRDAKLNAHLATLATPPLRAGPSATRIAYSIPARGQVAIGMGEIGPTGTRARGLTISTPPGTPVRAPAAGRIAYAGPFRGYGAIVIIDHGHGWTSLLAGMDQADAQIDSLVVRGASLGRMGRSDPLLTIELRHHARPVDVAAIAAWRGS